MSPLRAAGAAMLFCRRLIATSACLLGVSALRVTAAGPLAPVLTQFTASDVPQRGAREVETPRNWPTPARVEPLVGHGLAEHPMLFAGEGHNVLFLVNDGTVVWTYECGRGGEIDDVWLMTNGHILYTRQNYLEEITPQKKVVWHYDAPPGTEIHTVQPIGFDKVLFIQNALPPRLIVLNKADGTIDTQFVLPAQSLNDPKTVHPQFRRVRMTAAGNFLLSYLKLGQVVECDREGRDLWRYEIPTPWAAIRLHNGNTLIVDEHDRLVREVNPEKKTVWEFSAADLPPNLKFRNIQTAERLANGNTVIFSSTGGAKPEERPGLLQCVEVTSDKKVVWALRDWKNLGPATTAQFLDQPGIPEAPGSMER